MVLLSIFETTRFPDRKAWLTTSNAVHIAYELGLDRVDSQHNSNNTLSDASDEEARYLWWCVWKLDTYLSIGLATPFGIEDASNLTAIPSTSVADFTNDKIAACQNICLGKTSDILIVMRQLSVADRAVPENFLILVDSLLREASTIRRLTLAAFDSPLLPDRRSLLNKNLSTFQANMPPTYKSIDHLGYETPIQYHQRLETSAKLHL